MQIGYLRNDYRDNGLRIPYSISLPFKDSSILIVGKSGSGKSLSAKLYVYTMLVRRESAVYIADYKGGIEYEALQGSPSYASGEKTIDMIRNYYDFFVMVRNEHLRLEQHYTLFIEEWFGLLTYAETKSKQLKNELMAKVGEILAVGRGLNIGIMLCVQRADAALFTAGTREQFQVILAFGRSSQEQFRMLGFSGELEENPTTEYKAGEALCMADGQQEPVELIVPYVKNGDVLSNNIRKLMDLQKPLCELVQAANEFIN